jgi:hypothetical protein
VRRLNPRRVKVHRNYTVEEVAKLYGVHKNTVRDWLKAGLPKIDGRRPILILGRQLAGFCTSGESAGGSAAEPVSSIAFDVGRPRNRRPALPNICRSRRVRGI